MPSPEFRFLFPLPYLVKPAPPLPRTAKGGQRAHRDGPPWVFELPCLGSPLYGLWGLFSLSLCEKLSIASQQGILAIIYPLLHQPRVPSPFFLDPIALMRRGFGAAAFISH